MAFLNTLGSLFRLFGGGMNQGQAAGYPIGDGMEIQTLGGYSPSQTETRPLMQPVTPPSSSNGLFRRSQPPQGASWFGSDPAPATRQIDTTAGRGPQSLDEIMANDPQQPQASPPGTMPEIQTLGGYSPIAPQQRPLEQLERITDVRPLIRGEARTARDINNDVAAKDAEILATQKGEDGGPREHSFWKRFGKGFIRGYKNQEGLIGAVGGGINSAASPQAEQVGALKDEKRGLLRSLGQQQAFEGVQAKQDLLNSQQDTEEAQQANYDNQMRNRDAQTLLDREKAAADERRYRASEEAKARAEEAKARSEQVDADEKAGKANREIEEENAKKRADWQEKNSKEQRERAQLIVDGEELQNDASAKEQLAQQTLDPDERRKLNAEAQTLRMKGRAMIRRGNEFKFTPEPKYRAASVKAPNTRIGTFSEGEIRKRLIDRGLTGRDLENAIAKAKSDGVIR